MRDRIQTFQVGTLYLSGGSGEKRQVGWKSYIGERLRSDEIRLFVFHG
jgi:hypothetical protein